MLMPESDTDEHDQLNIRLCGARPNNVQRAWFS